MRSLDSTPPAILLGTSAFGSERDAFPVYDAFWKAGHRGFDTAWIYGFSYGPGCCERVFGQWARSRGVTTDAWVLAKGGHTPECYPGRLPGQFSESLDRMQRSHVAMYQMHRDNPEVPVGEFVTALAEMQHSGHIASYGFSNWTLGRVREAVAYARENNLPGPSGVSNQFSLISMIRPVHPGSLSANDDAWRDWLARNQVFLYPWASQGRGAHVAADLQASPLADCWFSEQNRQRIERARKLAAGKGVSPTALALSWVLAQPFPVRPIIGPRRVAEVHDSLRALSCPLTSAERDWLEDGNGAG
ncbi:MAG TPA: aldo/keto reductase [Streptosporangiaceae bacterium]